MTRADSSAGDAFARNATFATTHWSTVLAAGDTASPSSQEALERLCRAYWFPLYAFVRRQGRSPEDAEDLIQGFLIYLLGRHVIGKARPELGRFRSFLLGCLKNYLAQQRDLAQAAKRGGDQRPVSLDAAEAERRLRTEPALEVTPEALFDQKWGVTVLAQALKSVEADYHNNGDGAFKAVVDDPVVSSEGTSEGGCWGVLITTDTWTCLSPTTGANRTPCSTTSGTGVSRESTTERL